MIYPLLFIIELSILWFLSRKINSRLLRILPTFVFVLFFFIGTLVHELSHFLMAKMLFVRVGGFTLIPQKGEREIVLGSVAIEKKDIFRRTLIGIAPIIVGIAVLFFVIYLSVSNDVYQDWRVALLTAYFVFVIGNTMFSSRRDLEGAWIVGVVLAAIIIGLYTLGVRINIKSDFETLKLLNTYLLVPIGIDVVILSALSLKRR